MRLLTTSEKLTIVVALIARRRDIAWKARRTRSGRLTLAHKERINYIKYLENLITDAKMCII